MWHIEIEDAQGVVESSKLEYPNARDADAVAEYLWANRVGVVRVTVKDREGDVYSDWEH